MENKPILAFDCSAAGASVTLWVNGIAETHRLAQGTQAVALVPAIDVLLRDKGIAYADLGTLITTVGPGSFTGLRIGLATLHGLALVNDTPVKLLTTLEAMAWSVFRRPHAPHHLVTVMKVGKGELAVQEFRWEHETPVASSEIYLVDESNTQWPATAYGNHLSVEDKHYLPDADTETLCRIAPKLPLSPLADALPLYIRPPDALIPKPAAWLAS